MRKTVLITGATSGIGKASAYIFAENGHNLIITGRRQNRLNTLAIELKTFGIEVLPLSFDIRDKASVKKHLSDLPAEWQTIDILINNAGLASGLGHWQDGDTEDWDKMIDTNIKGLLYVSKALIPYVKNSDAGHIINIGSTAGKEVYENGNVYCASKHAVDAISQAMRIDLLKDGIKVTQICPGMAETEFSEVRFHGDKEMAKKVYEGFDVMSAEDVASIIYYSTTLPKHLCINDLVLTSTAQANSFYTDRQLS
ncbi:MAG: SDR family NAD(P)-dependent oxidoreductase [Crocinitomicaceae bacterium]